MNEYLKNFDTIRFVATWSIFRNFLKFFYFFEFKSVSNRPVPEPVRTDYTGNRGFRTGSRRGKNPGSWIDYQQPNKPRSTRTESVHRTYRRLEKYPAATGTSTGNPIPPRTLVLFVASEAGCVCVFVLYTYISITRLVTYSYMYPSNTSLNRSFMKML